MVAKRRLRAKSNPSSAYSSKSNASFFDTISSFARAWKWGFVFFLCGLLVLYSASLRGSTSRGFFSRPFATNGSTTQLLVDDQRVIQMRNFFPRNLAERWRSILRKEWLARNDPQTQSSWLYATNNDGSTYGGNAKTRSLENVQARREFAGNVNARGQFSYGKYELATDHSLILEMKEFMLRSETRDRIATALGVDVANIETTELSDLFVTNFAPGDFLSAHADGYSGTYAFVASLAEEEPWLDQFGGGLSFFCQQSRTWCNTLMPTFNSLTLFRTRVKGAGGPTHRVDVVQEVCEEKGQHRFGFTGWYRDVEDVWSEDEIAERNKMRDRND